MLNRAYGGGAAAAGGLGGGGVLRIAKKQDGKDAIFASFSDLENYYKNRPKPNANEAAATGAIGPNGIATAIHTAYQWEKGQWHSVVANFKGDPGARGKPGAGLEPSLLSDGEIPRWDANKQELVSSGLSSSKKGELQVSPDSIVFGNHEMAAAIENVAFRNLETHRVYAPLWQEMAAGQGLGYVREYSDTIEKVVRVPPGNIDVTNPTNAGVVIDSDELFIGGSFTLSQPATNLMLMILDANDKTLVWRQRLGSHRAGKVTVTFEIPFDMRSGYKYDISLVSEDGSDVVVKSNKSTGFSWEASRVKWVDKPLASLDWVTAQIAKIPAGRRTDPGAAVTAISLDGDRLTITHGDGAKHVIQLPTGGSAPDISGLRGEVAALMQDLTNKGNDIQALKNQYGQLDHKIESLSGSYSYDGDLLPAFPDDPKHSYFVHLHGTAARDIVLNLPNPTNGRTLDGTLFMVGNANAQAKVTLQPNSAETIEGKQSFELPANHYAVLVKSGTNWIKIIDSSLQASQVPINITPDMLSKALDRGEFTGSGSVKQLDTGWWVIPASNTAITGKPAGARGDLILSVSEAGRDSSGRARYGVNLAFGKDRDNNDQAWAEYRDGTSWTPWIQLYQADGSPVDLTQINQDIAALKAGQASNAGAITSLRTDLGNVFAPDKTKFDAEVGTLITAALKPVKDEIATAFKSIAGLPQKIEQELIAKGWGPLSGSGPAGGQGTHHTVRLPEIKVMFGVAQGIPTAFSDETTSTTGVATILRASGDLRRIFVFVENDNGQANKVTGIEVNKGLASAWGHRDVVMDGKKYRCFYSAGAYTETKAEIKVNFE